MRALRQVLLDTVSKAIDEGPTLVLTAAQMRELLKLALLAARQARRIAPQEVVTVWDPSAWSKITELLTASERFKGAAQTCKQVVQIASAPQKDGPPKRKAHSVSDGTPSETKKPKRKKVA